MKLIRDISYCADGHPAKKLDLYLPEGTGFPTFVYFHGGGLESGDKAQDGLGTYLTSRGIALATANYRMYPTARYPEFIMDAACAVAFVKEQICKYGGNDRIYVGGSSAGGYLSMMLCFDKRYLAPYNIDPDTLAGFVHDAGQPTKHFNVLREYGEDTRKIVVDEAAPLYHIGKSPAYAPMMFIVSDNDMENRYEQTMLMLSTLKHFRYSEDKIRLEVMHGNHCAYVSRPADENGVHEFGKMIADFIDTRFN
ncbi:MAG: alpha/beta hydrolase [Clostridia bacterium]|nr:alpha/beta hydrolase [Clostridia bacterium]